MAATSGLKHRPGPRTRFVARKLGFYAVAAWAALTLNFFLPRLIPGNPVELLLAKMAQAGPVPPGEQQVLSKLLGLGTGSLFEQQDEIEFNANDVAGYPTLSNPYAAPAVYISPDLGWVADRLAPAS